jgi:hypothetical protein
MATRLGWLVWPVIIVASVMAVVVMLIALSAVPKADAQNTNQTQKGAEVTTQSLTPKASFASGTNATRFAVQVSNHGNLLSFESPAGAEAVSAGREGYAVCSFSSAGGDVVHGHDTGGVKAGFGPPTIVQPNPGAFPLTVTRNTTDGKFQLKQVWNQPDAAEKDITVTMTLKNKSNAAISSVALSRSGDYDVGTSGADAGLRTADTVMLWDDFNSLVDSPPVGARMTALSFGTPHFLDVETRFNWAEEGTLSTRRVCEAVSEETPAPDSGNYAMRVVYGLGSINAGASKTVKFAIGRM